VTSGTVQGQDHQELRPLLLSIAYRMVGSVTEAENLVQDAYLRFHRSVAAGEVIDSPQAYLSAIVTRLAIDTSGPPACGGSSTLAPGCPNRC
jgi:DNA-directed RNA polymerase specialized sigma24 family protein